MRSAQVNHHCEQRTVTPAGPDARTASPMQFEVQHWEVT